MRDKIKEMAEKAATKYKELAEKQDEGEKQTFNVVISTNDVDRHGDIIDPEGMELDTFRKNPVVLFGHNHFELPVGKATDIQQESNRITAKGEFAPAEANPQAGRVAKLFDLGILTATSVGIIVKEIKIGEETLSRDYMVENGILKKGDGSSTEAKFYGKDGEGETIDRGAACKAVDEEDEENADIVITKSELIEFSFVAVPANPHVDVIEESGEDVNDYIGKGVMYLDTKSIGSEKKDEGESFEKTVERVKEQTREKSPACRMSDETQEECVNRKVPEILEENPEMEQNQAVAIANSMCEEACDEEEEASYKANETKQEEPEPVVRVGERMSSLATTVDDAITNATQVVLDIVREATGEDTQEESAADTKDRMKSLIKAQFYSASVLDKSGRVLSDENRKKVQAVREALNDGVDVMDELIAADDDKGTHDGKSKQAPSETDTPSARVDGRQSLERSVKAVNSATAEFLRDLKRSHKENG